MFILPFTYRNPNLATCYFTLLQDYDTGPALKQHCVMFVGGYHGYGMRTVVFMVLQC